MATTDKARATTAERVEREYRAARPREIEGAYVRAVERQLDTEKRLRERNAAWVNRFDRLARP